MSKDERYEYAVALHKLVMAYDAADWDSYEPYPGLSEEVWALLRRDYGGKPLPTDERRFPELCPCDDPTIDIANTVREVLIEATDIIPHGAEPYVGWSAVLAERIVAALRPSRPKERFIAADEERQ